MQKAALIDISLLKENPDNPKTHRRLFFGCQNCRKVFYSKKLDKGRTPKYCSRGCHSESMIKIKPDKTPRVSRKGQKLSTEWKAALSAGRKASDKCKGPNLYNWKGGKETEAERSRERNKIKYHQRKAAGELPLSYLASLRVIQGDKCFYCDGQLLYDKSTHIEHLTPVSRGGDNHWQNLVLSCQSCNNQKRANTLTEFVIKKLRPDWWDKSLIIQTNAFRISQRIPA